MKLNAKALSLTIGLIWGLGFFFIAAANHLWPPYGGILLNVIESVYPGYEAGAGITSVFIGLGWAFLDGCIGGWIIAWLYNKISGAN